MTGEARLQIRSTVDEGGENRFILTGTIDAYLAEELHHCALDLLESERDIAVDLSASSGKSVGGFGSNRGHNMLRSPG